MGGLTSKISDKVGDLGMSSLGLNASPGFKGGTFGKKGKEGKDGDKKKGLLGKMKW